MENPEKKKQKNPALRPFRDDFRAKSSGFSPFRSTPTPPGLLATTSAAAASSGVRAIDITEVVTLRFGWWFYGDFKVISW